MMTVNDLSQTIYHCRIHLIFIILKILAVDNNLKSFKAVWHAKLGCLSKSCNDKNEGIAQILFAFLKGKVKKEKLYSQSNNL